VTGRRGTTGDLVGRYVLGQSGYMSKSETWTLLAVNIKRLEAFHMKCQHQVAKIRWQDHVCAEKQKCTPLYMLHST